MAPRVHPVEPANQGAGRGSQGLPTNGAPREAFGRSEVAGVDVLQPEDDERLAWVVADEGRGPDVVLEVLHRGGREKDLVDNVERYARLGIPEYFVYDREKPRVR